MKKLFFILFLISDISFGQQKSFKKFETISTNLEINTKGLDQIIVENSDDNFVSISLDEENPYAHYIFSSEENGMLRIGFKPEVKQKNKVFRKFITERLNRASVKIKIPKNKNLTFLGDDIDIITENYHGNLTVLIEKGELKFNNLKGNLQLHLFSGNVFLSTYEGSFDIKSSKGKINVNNDIEQTPFKKLDKNSTRKISIKSINANITLTTKKP